MAWRTVGSQRYYQQTYRDVDGTVRTRYVGRGPAAEAVAALDVAGRARRIEDRELARTERERLARLEGPLVEYCEGVDGPFDAWMRLSAWHQHKGPWRRTGRIKRRNRHTLTKIDELLAAEVFRRPEQEGHLTDLIETYGGDLAGRVLDMIISSITDDPKEREALRRQYARLRDDLAGPAPSASERVLAERVAVAHFDSYYSDLLAHSHYNMLHGDFVQRRQDRAERRYLRAVRALAECRKIEASTVRRAAEELRLVV
jgi:hypothetical protein